MTRKDEPGLDTLVSRGEVYRARAPGGFRSVVVDAVEYDPPRAVVREIVSDCDHAALRALAGACPICPPAGPKGDPFTVGLTVRAGPPYVLASVRAWRMPEWYQPVP